jgi:glycosyltransferase involved in cell wall biosynthesis
MIQRKKKILFQTDFVLAKTGFGKNAKAIFEYLYATDKYELINFAVGSVDVHVGPESERTPWKTIASVNSKQLEEIKRQNDPRSWEGIERMAGYGAYALDNALKQEKPDVFFGIQDIWGIDFSVDKGWFNKITSVLWTTLDSLPILPKAVELAPKIKNYWSWADFATKALHKIGHKHVRTVHGAIDTKPFYRLSDTSRLDLRKKFGIPEKAFIIGFVFRNQLRKSVPNLLQGYKQFKTNNPRIVTRLLLHTCWTEGWDIPKLLVENNIPQEEVLTTYICKNCREYSIKAFVNNEQDCNKCRAQKAQCTTHPSIGITDAQLNEVYNLMDVYCHPFTSGGQEIPIQEAKLAELITLVTNYSCGEDMCVDEAASLPLDWAEYREPGTQFIKASTYPSDIAKQLSKVFNMKEQTKREMGKKARQFVLNNYSIEVIGKIIEEFIDNAPFLASDSAFDDSYVVKDPYCAVSPEKDNEEWLMGLYRNILKREDITKNDEGLKYWMSLLAEGRDRESIEQFFRNTAFTENQKAQQNTSFEDLLDKNDKGRVLVVMPESAGDIFLLSSLFESIKKRYPTWALYVATKPEYKTILENNPYMDKWIEYNPMMDNLIWLEGNAYHNGYFDIAYQPHLQTQRQMNHTHNGKDKLDFKIQ